MQLPIIAADSPVVELSAKNTLAWSMSSHMYARTCPFSPPYVSISRLSAFLLASWYTFGLRGITSVIFAPLAKAGVSTSTPHRSTYAAATVYLSHRASSIRSINAG